MKRPGHRFPPCKRLLLALLLLVGVPGLAARAQPGTVAPQTMAEMANEARRANGRARLAWSEPLAVAAQRHAEDIAGRDDPSPAGSDGPTLQARAVAAGVVAYPDGVRVAGSWATGSALEAMALFLEDAGHRDTLLLPLWREIGVGQATTATGRTVWVLLFGAQPGVLPIFVNDDAPRTTERRVTVQIRGEEAGEATAIFGRPVEMRLGEGATVAAAPWVPWQPEVTWELSAGGGEKEVVVEMRDAQGRVVRAADTIYLVAPEGPVPTPRAQLAPTLTPSATPTATATPTITPTPTGTPTATPTPTPLLALPRGTNGPLLLLGVGLVLVGLGVGLGMLWGGVSRRDTRRGGSRRRPPLGDR